MVFGEPRKLLRPSVLLPAVLSVSVLGGLIAFSGGGKVFQEVLRFQPIWLVPFVGMMLGYEAARLLQSHLLRHLGIRAPVQTEALAYLGGEVAKYFPGGTLLQNYVLFEARGTDVGLSTSATTAAIVMEPVAAVLILLVFGVAAWPWLRPVIGILVLLTALVALVLWRWQPRIPVPGRIRRSRAWKWASEESKSFGEGLREVLDPGLLLVQGLLGPVYVLLGGGRPLPRPPGDRGRSSQHPRRPPCLRLRRDCGADGADHDRRRVARGQHGGDPGHRRCGHLGGLGGGGRGPRPDGGGAGPVPGLRGTALSRPGAADPLAPDPQATQR
ncbi:MAG: lysylphosphatidylglycerol synthase domain-containing protein [Candidatus Dormibacteria bacterium]